MAIWITYYTTPLHHIHTSIDTYHIPHTTYTNDTYTQYTYKMSHTTSPPHLHPIHPHITPYHISAILSIPTTHTHTTPAVKKMVRIQTSKMFKMFDNGNYMWTTVYKKYMLKTRKGGEREGNKRKKSATKERFSPGA